MNLVDQLQLDYKAELLASCFLNEEDDFGKIIIRRLGNNARTYTKDVYKLYEDWNNLDTTSQVVIETFRQSIYDALPENIFHPSTLGGLGKTEAEIVLEIQQQQRKEAEARKFFMPFEQEASYVEMQALLTELRLDKKVEYDDMLRLFEKGWPILNRLPRMTALAFIYMLPILHKVRGKKSWIEKSLAFILGYPITIKEVFELKPIERNNIAFITGEAKLAINTALKGAQYDGVPEWNIKIGPIPPGAVSAVLPGSGFTDLVDLLLGYFVPAYLFASYTVCTEREATFLNVEKKEKARLGYSFYL